MQSPGQLSPECQWEAVGFVCAGTASPAVTSPLLSSSQLGPGSLTATCTLSINNPTLGLSKGNRRPGAPPLDPAWKSKTSVLSV